MMQRAFCAECGRQVPLMLTTGGKWKHGHCPSHPKAKRLPAAWFIKAFAEIRRVVEGAR